MDMSSPLARARGHGTSSEGGTLHWWGQRLTSIAMAPLALWFIYSAIGLVGADHGAFTSWISELGNLLLMSLFILTMFNHIGQGMQVVVEDYIHGEAAKIATLLALKGFIYIGGASALLSIFIVVFGN
ncbi:MAG TPA: succinate dehydrogenase, hydrophobic membrane anchor protein [Rhodospirillales bacterium]|nr:succinate dehydrogenase, hydrophobic membrane anchor protein [Rhodospirillales bacterium]